MCGASILKGKSLETSSVPWGVSSVTMRVMIRYTLFDLDNTLYPSSLGLDEEMVERIGAFVARYLELSEENARALRSERSSRYGTTLEWLMAEKGLEDIEAYYAAVHPEGEEARLEPDPELRAFLERLPVPAAILTNAPMEHAERVLRKLDLEGLFTHIFDIRWNGLKGKPAESAFRRVLQALDMKSEEVLFVDDLPSYVEGFARLGGRGVLLDERDLHVGSIYPRVRTLFEITKFLDLP
jgi:putative hydrolase of the HAD superfamily